MIGRRRKLVLYSPLQARPDGVPYTKDVLPMAMLAIAGWPVRDGYEVVLIDGGLMSQAESHQRVLEACEGALLFATTSILGYQVADGHLCSLAVRERHPQLPQVIGGWFASAAPELVLSTGLYEAAALGQGEETFRELVQAIEAGTPLEDVAGLALWRDGEVVRTAPRGAVGWDRLPPTPWHLIDFEPYRQQQLSQRGRRQWEEPPAPPDAHDPARKQPWVGISYFASYGCPLQCTFCCSPGVTGLRWKSMPAERMLDDLQDLQQRWGFDVVRFADANYGVLEKRVADFAAGVVERGLRLWQFAMMQSPSVLRFEPRTLDLMAASGMYDVLLGGETGTDETMISIKTTRGDENVRAAHEVARRGMSPQLTYIIGFPGEDEASMLATIEQVREVQKACPDANAQVWPYRPIPGTPLFREALELGYQPPRTLLEWGEIGDYRRHETWRGKIPAHVARRRRLYHHFAGLSKGIVRGRKGWWERRARQRIESGDWRLARLEAKAFDVVQRLTGGR